MRIKTWNVFGALLVMLSLFGAVSHAQTISGRKPGYRGSIAVTDNLGVFVGAETSHGYLFDAHNYLGIGIGGFILPNGTGNPVFGNAFLDYRYYLKDKPGTLVLGVKSGYSHAFTYDKDSGVAFRNGILLEPTVGWCWGLKNGCGFSLGLGLTMIAPLGESRTDKKVLPLPKLAIGFEF